MNFTKGYMKNKSKDKNNNVYHHEDDLKNIAKALKEKLCVEIIWSAMNKLKIDPDSSITEAIEYGYNEWIK